MSRSLSQRLQALVDSYKQTLNLIQELQSFPSSQRALPGDPDQRRLELANEIHDSLKEQEDTLDLLRQEVEDDSYQAPRGGAESTLQSDRSSERERNVDRVARLDEDLKAARGKFRRAQLQAKRNADAAKRKEREQLFADRKLDQSAPRRQGQEKLTQDELALNASEDVTRALRRAHDLLQGNLTQSQFAQQTLDDSQEALKGLSESYGGTGDLLKNSRSLVGQLVRSNKSDTWYLQSAFYLISITIAWLVFRRILYGPLWWFVYQPLRLTWWMMLSVLGTLGLKSSGSDLAASKSSSMVSSLSVNARGFPMNQPGGSARSMALPGKGGGWDRNPQPKADEPESMVEQVGRMMGESDRNTFIDDTSQDENQVDEGQPRNTKKRMMEYEAGSGNIKDEL